MKLSSYFVFFVSFVDSLLKLLRNISPLVALLRSVVWVFACRLISIRAKTIYIESNNGLCHYS